MNIAAATETSTSGRRVLTSIMVYSSWDVLPLLGAQICAAGLSIHYMLRCDREHA
jgi:hypothetical protein